MKAMSITSDLLIEPVEDLRKVLRTVTLIATQGLSAQNDCDPEAVFGFCELIEDRLQAIYQALESAMETIDEASAQNRTSNAAIRDRKRKATLRDEYSSHTAAGHA